MDEDVGDPAGSVRARVGGAPLWCHALALALLLVVLGLVLRPEGVVISDEGAAIAQAKALQGELGPSGWTIEHPLEAADPTGEAFPLEKSVRGDDGYAPLAKHPTYPLLLAGQPLGLAGMVGLSTLGTVLVAVVAALLARRMDPTTDRLALWVVGLASPLLFYAYLVKAHSLAAAAAGAATLLALRGLERGRPMAYVGSAAFGAIATLLRTEGLLFAAALALVILLSSGADRRRSAVIGGIGVGAAALGAYLLDSRVTGLLVPGAGPETSVGGARAGLGPFERLEVAAETLVRPGYEAGPVPFLVLGVLALVVTAAALARWAPGRATSMTGLLWAAAALVVLLLLQPPALVPGLLAAFPLLAGGLVLGVGRTTPPDARRCTWLVLLFAVAVFATQYRDAGGAQWGARFLLLSMPLLVPIALSGSRAAAARLDPAVVRRAIPALVVVAVGFALVSVGSIARIQAADRSLVDAAVEAAAQTTPGDGGAPVLVSTGRALPRMAWSRLDEARWLRISDDALPEHGDDLASAGVQELVVVAPSVEQVCLLGYAPTTVHPLPGGWEATVFVDRGSGADTDR